MKKGRIIIITILILIIGSLGGAMFYYQNGLKAVSNESEEVIFEVTEGTTYSEIITKLADEGLIKNELVAKIYLKINKLSTLKANTYRLNKNMDFETILDILGSGDFDYLVTDSFTVIEGLTIPKVAEVISTYLISHEQLVSTDDILAKLADEDFLNQLIEKYWFLTDEILDENIMFPLEGYLYPETYILSSSEIGVESMVYTMLDMTDSILTPYKESIENMGWSVHEFLSFVAVVERESMHDEDRPKIAGVFMNRLNANMLLQSDITVLYALQVQRVAVTYADLEVESLYNTYKYVGLPVGPISNVSRVTIDACINYEKSDYYYFFAIKDGKVIYTSTLSEHESEIQKAKDAGLWLTD